MRPLRRLCLFQRTSLARVLRPAISCAVAVADVQYSAVAVRCCPDSGRATAAREPAETNWLSFSFQTTFLPRPAEPPATGVLTPGQSCLPPGGSQLTLTSSTKTRALQCRFPIRGRTHPPNCRVPHHRPSCFCTHRPAETGDCLRLGLLL